MNRRKFLLSAGGIFVPIVTGLALPPVLNRVRGRNARRVVAQSTLNTGLVSVWLLNEANATDAAADAVGSNTLGAQGNPTTGSGKIGGCRITNGSTQYFAHSDNAQLTFATSDFTIFGWVNFTALPASGFSKGIFGKYLATGNKREYECRVINTAGTYNIQHVFSANGTAVTQLSNTDTTITTGVWYAVAIGKSANKPFVYKDGTLVTNGTESDFFAGTAVFEMGKTSDGYLNGQHDQVACWSRALTVTELAELYNSGNGKAYPW